MRGIFSKRVISFQQYELSGTEMASCRWSRKSGIILSTLIILMLVITLAVLGLLLSFDAIVESKLGKSVLITPSSQVYTNWLTPSKPVYFSVYLYNITNVEEIAAGKKPKVNQIGPYVYREKREKMNITWPEGDYSKISYFFRITYFFERNLSVGDPDTDIVQGLSIPFVTMSSNMMAGNGPSGAEYTFLSLFYSPKLFVTMPISDYIWGYSDEITVACNSVSQDKCPSEKVGLMFGKNGTVDGPFVADTGYKNISNVGMIYSYRGHQSMNVWPTRKANMIHGTDGSHFAPGITPSSEIFIFSHDLCRSFKMLIAGEGKLTNSDKIKVYSVEGTPETAQHVSKNPDNLAFCPEKTPGTKCPPAGLFDLSSCKMAGGTRPPIYSSLAHFYGADPALRQAVNGLPPATQSTSATKLLVEPRTGVVLEAFKRLQINVYVNPHYDMESEFGNWTKPIFFPVAWFEEGAAADAETLDMLYDNLYVMPTKGYQYLLILFGVSLGLLLLLTIILISLCCARLCSSTSSTTKSQKSRKKCKVTEGVTGVQYAKAEQEVSLSHTVKA